MTLPTVLRQPFLILKTARPRQWLKNAALYAALIFSGFLFEVTASGLPYVVVVSYAVLIFCFLTSSIYIINDIIDREADRRHPFKRKRPIASGELPISTAIFAAIAGLGIVFFLSLWLSIYFKAIIGGYFLLQMLYSTYLKHIAILDVFSIATGFVLRIYAGAVVVDLHMSVWFLLTVISASLFLAVGKRQSERTLLRGADTAADSSGAAASIAAAGTRKSLQRYSERLLDQYTGMFANATWLTYALFTFQRESVGASFAAPVTEIYSILPRTFRSQKLLMLTIPLVIFGVMRYLQLVYEDNQGESPERVLLRDLPLLATTIIFGLSVLFIIYVLG